MTTPIKIFSNVKKIVSGNIPTTDDLRPGEIAFGKITGTGAFHIFGNPGDLIDPGNNSLPGTIIELGNSGGTGSTLIASTDKPGGLAPGIFWIKLEEI